MSRLWFLSLGVCAIAATLAHSQSNQSPNALPGEPRAVVPAGLTAPANRLPERANVRGFAETGDERARLPATSGRSLLPPNGSDRSYRGVAEPSRMLTADVPARDPALLRREPGDRVNKLPDTAPNRLLNPDTSPRQLLPDRALLERRFVAGFAPNKRDEKLLADVAAKLIAVSDRPEGFEWPPDIGFEEGGINAYSTAYRKGGKLYPVVRVHHGLMEKVVRSDKPGAADRLAMILGHEVGHIVKGHLTAKPGRDKTPFLKITFERPEEIEADLYGLQLLLKAGYDLQEALKGIERIKEVLKELGYDYSSFEGLGKDHPSWDDRLAKADKDKADLWKAMAAFNNGVVFLTVEDYVTAIDCFEKVAKQFPKCHEAWANLGYARLMRYCDKWDAKDIRDHGIGQVVAGGFYYRMDKPVRGIDKKLWQDAVDALKESDRLKPAQTVVLANLGLAYLLDPAGKNVAKADEWFDKAHNAARADKTLDPVVNATLLINRGITTLATGNTEKGLARLDEGEKIVRSFAGRDAKRLVPSFDAALLYTRAMVHAGKNTPDDKDKAINLLGQYLRTTSPRSLWWEPAYEQYAGLCKALSREAKAREAFKKERPEPLRLVTGLKVKDTEIRLGDALDAIARKLGKGQTSTAVQDTELLRVRYEADGVELLGTEDSGVLAIHLVGPSAPALALTGKMLGTGAVGSLKIGMTVKEVEELLGEDYTPCEIATVDKFYRYYREQGVAVRVSQKKVVELVVVQIP
jgi:tetratricopeptide (TPR) repeat protein